MSTVPLGSQRFSQLRDTATHSHSCRLRISIPYPESGTNKIRTRRFTKGIMALPDFLKKTNYQNPTSPTDTAFQMGYETDMGFFGYVQQEPLTAKQFNNHMSVYAQGRVRWMDPGFYPVQEQLIDGVTIGGDDVLLVDVGGSFGHDISDFRRKWPGVPGRLVLQDLPEVVVSVKDLHPSIDVTGHDFFTEQPVKGTEIEEFTVSLWIAI